MQIATVVVKNLQGNLLTKICLILDSGSQRSFIIANRALSGLTEWLPIITFDIDKPKKRDSKLSKVQLSLKDERVMTLKVMVVPNIS